jgi:hypothetical protein
LAKVKMTRVAAPKGSTKAPRAIKPARRAVADAQ